MLVFLPGAPERAGIAVQRAAGNGIHIGAAHRFHLHVRIIIRHPDMPAPENDAGAIPERDEGVALHPGVHLDPEERIVAVDRHARIIRIESLAGEDIFPRAVIDGADQQLAFADQAGILSLDPVPHEAERPLRRFAQRQHFVVAAGSAVHAQSHARRVPEHHGPAHRDGVRERFVRAGRRLQHIAVRIDLERQPVAQVFDPVIVQRRSLAGQGDVVGVLGIRFQVEIIDQVPAQVVGIDDRLFVVAVMRVDPEAGGAERRAQVLALLGGGRIGVGAQSAQVGRNIVGKRLRGAVVGREGLLRRVEAHRIHVGELVLEVDGVTRALREVSYIVVLPVDVAQTDVLDDDLVVAGLVKGVVRHVDDDLGAVAPERQVHRG